ncbi:MAG: hypothetical protein KC994_21180 [Candidatus Omnitrophica bacterium]|nr:hypothetical protein [Candidatus Omnitrophota bacterium]MCA9435772.1 hypothetical protein [Candidatus Omnitrophota bacterium]
MAQWAEKVLYLGLILVAFGILLRLVGYHQARGFLQGSLLENGITPRAFLLGGAALGIFASAIANVHIAKHTGQKKPDAEDQDQV